MHFRAKLVRNTVAPKVFKYLNYFLHKISMYLLSYFEQNKNIGKSNFCNTHLLTNEFPGFLYDYCI